MINRKKLRRPSATGEKRVGSPLRFGPTYNPGTFAPLFARPARSNRKAFFKKGR